MDQLTTQSALPRLDVLLSPLDVFRSDMLPTFLIIGAQKAGTTSLASYLTAHPDVVASKWKEVHFFDLNYAKGRDWYRAHFPVGRKRKLRSRLPGSVLMSGDATPYYLLHPRVPERAAKLLPDARIIIMLRDPVDRAYSHYHHEVRLGIEPLTFEDAIAAEPIRIAGELEKLQSDSLYQSVNYQHFTYLERGIYAVQILRWLKWFRRDRILMLSAEQFFKDPKAEYERVLSFLGLRPFPLPSYPAEHVGRYSPLSSRMKDSLREFYSPHNQVLRHEINRFWPDLGDKITAYFSA